VAGDERQEGQRLRTIRSQGVQLGGQEAQSSFRAARKREPKRINLRMWRHDRVASVLRVERPVVVARKILRRSLIAVYGVLVVAIDHVCGITVDEHVGVGIVDHVCSGNAVTAVRVDAVVIGIRLVRG